MKTTWLGLLVAALSIGCGEAADDAPSSDDDGLSIASGGQRRRCVDHERWRDNRGRNGQADFAVVHCGDADPFLL